MHQSWTFLEPIWGHFEEFYCLREFFSNDNTYFCTNSRLIPNQFETNFSRKINAPTWNQFQTNYNNVRNILSYQFHTKIQKCLINTSRGYYCDYINNFYINPHTISPRKDHIFKSNTLDDQVSQHIIIWKYKEKAIHRKSNFETHLITVYENKR